MTNALPFINLALTLLILVLGWVWTSGRWAKTQELDLSQLSEEMERRLVQIEKRLDRAGDKMSDLSGELQVFAALGYKVKALEDACEDLPALREEIVTLRTVLRLRKRNGKTE